MILRTCTIFIRIVAGRLFISRPIFPINILSILGKTYFGESSYSSRSVIAMMQNYDEHGYSRGRVKKIYSLLLGSNYLKR